MRRATFLLVALSVLFMAGVVPPGAAQQARPAPTPAPPAAAPAGTEAPAAPAAPSKPSAAYPLDPQTLAEKVARSPNEPALLNEYGNQLIRSGRLEDALGQYLKAVRLQPQMATAWNNLGVAYMGLGRHGRATRAFKRAIALQPNYALAWYNLGALSEQKGDFNGAVNNFEKAIRLDRRLADIRYNPSVASTRVMPAAMVKDYIDRGSTYLPAVDSTYPAQRRKPNP